MKAWSLILGACLMLTACSHAPVRSQPTSAPSIAPVAPKPRPLHAGDFLLKGKPEIMPNGTVVCHHAIQTIDSTKSKESVIVYTCR